MSKKDIVIATMRWPKELHQKAEAAAAETFTSMNSFVLQAVQEKLKRGDWFDHPATKDE